MPVFEHPHGRKTKIIISNQNFLCSEFPVAFVLLLVTVEGTVILNALQVWNKRMGGLCLNKLVSYMREVAVPSNVIIIFSWCNI